MSVEFNSCLYDMFAVIIVLTSTSQDWCHYSINYLIVAGGMIAIYTVSAFHECVV